MFEISDTMLSYEIADNIWLFKNTIPKKKKTPEIKKDESVVIVTKIQYLQILFVWHSSKMKFHTQPSTFSTQIN